jgi:hypothetical protein
VYPLGLAKVPMLPKVEAVIGGEQDYRVIPEVQGVRSLPTQKSTMVTSPQ